MVDPWQTSVDSGVNIPSCKPATAMNILNTEPRIEDFENVVNTYAHNSSRRYLNSMAQKNLIIRIQKNLVNSLKSHIISLREYIDIQNRIIDSE